MTSRSTWKALERKTAKKLGGVRNPLSGINSKHTSGDVIHSDYYIECKLRAKWAIASLFDDIRKEANTEDKTPLLIIKEKSKHGELVVMDIADFMQIAGMKQNTE